MKTVTIDSSKKIEVVPVLELQHSEENLSKLKFLEPRPSFKPETLGYLNYLAYAWKYHYAVVLNPHDIWYMVLCELSLQIKKKPSRYSNLFTTTPDEKQLILVLTHSVESINPSAVISALKSRVPTSVDNFFPKFSTTTPMVEMAMNVAFCDMVSPYYNYGTFLCGIPRVEIGGTREDWINVEKNLFELHTIFDGSLSDYLHRCWTLIGNILDAFDDEVQSQKLFSKMVRVERCGSGGQKEMSGWILHFLNRKDYTRPLQMEGLHTHISSMDYKNMDTEREFKLSAGIFYSTNNNTDTLYPVYNAHRVEITGKTGEEKKEKVPKIFPQPK